MRCTGCFENLDRLFNVSGEDGSSGGHGVNCGGIFWVGFSVAAFGVMLFRVSPSADLEAELAVIGVLC